MSAVAGISAAAAAQVAAGRLKPLPYPPAGFRYYRSKREILSDSAVLQYQHFLLRAWEEMKLNGVLTIDGIPTVCVRDVKRPLAPAEAAEAHRQFWNQGVATVLLLRDPRNVRVFSSMTRPLDPTTSDEAQVAQRMVERIDFATQASWAERFYLRLATGQYYAGQNAPKFDPQQAVDAYLINNLAAVRDELTKGGSPLPAQVAHAFLGRLLFTCYLCDRGIIELVNYFPNCPWKSLRDLLAAHDGGDARPALYGTLFPALKRDFNGSMFDDDLAGELEWIQPTHIQAIRRFLDGDEVRRGQRTLGFWAYDFKFIPVETISAIYENFLEKEGGPEKRKSGAYYTPRFLAEMTLDLALEGVQPLRGKRFLDPSCGSGIFLVLLFNRLAAEWLSARKSQASPQEKAEVLQHLLGSLSGVDKSLTACRIACFSLYLAFLDQFDPPDVRAYMQATGEKLPILLRARDAKKKVDLPVVWERDFFEIAPEWKGQFDVVVGNPPWAGRGSKQVAHKFMEATPDLLTAPGRACLLLPSKVFLNRTDAFQARWLRQVSLDKVVQLADYSFILFKEAMCPCNIARFAKAAPDVTTHEIEYVTPKVSRVDLRDGVIPVSPHDRKWIPLRLLLNAAEQKATAVAWKSHLWGSRRDLKFLDYLFSLPRLGELAGTVKEMQRGKKPWCKGQGFQPLRPGSKTDHPRPLKWNFSEQFVTPELIEGLFTVPKQVTLKLGAYLQAEGYRLDKLHRPRDERVYEPPLALWNQGFTTAAFFDYRVRFQHSLQSISGKLEDADALVFLTAFLRSKIARYFVFHTAANLGTERDKAHMPEVLRLPFFLPCNEVARPGAGAIVAKVAARVRSLKAAMEAGALDLLQKCHSAEFRLRADDEQTEDEGRQQWLHRQREKSRELQAELDPLIYEYFGLNEQEVALLEDTCDIFDRSDTPGSLEAAKDTPTLKPLGEAADLAPYADMLATTLNGWATGVLRTSASGGVDVNLGLGLVELTQTKAPQAFRPRTLGNDLANALNRLQQASTEHSSRLAYLLGSWLFDDSRIYIVKPSVLGHWTRTAALNDAADLYAHIAEARRHSNQP